MIVVTKRQKDKNTKGQNDKKDKKTTKKDKKTTKKKTKKKIETKRQIRQKIQKKKKKKKKWCPQGAHKGVTTCPHILLNQTGVKSGLKVRFLEVSNPGLEGF